MSFLHDEVQRILLNNRRNVDGHQFTLPSPISYPYQWLWDSCFHAIILTHFNCDDAKAELRSLVARQHDNGFIGHVTYWNTEATQFRFDWGVEHTSNLTQPPIIAYAVWRIFQRTEELSWLQEMYRPLANYYDFLLQTRDVRDVGLLGLINPDESGEDNSPRFDEAMALDPMHEASVNTQKRYDLFHIHRDCDFSARCTSQTFWVEDVPFNSYMIWNLDVLADIATALNELDDATRYRDATTAIKKAMRQQMFKDDVFWSLSGLTGEPIRIKTTAQFIPLIAGLYEPAEAERLITHWLLNESTFWRPAGVSTVAADEISYDPDEPTWGEPWQRPHWRGPVWMAPHWFIYHGLVRYGFTDIAADLKKKSLRLVSESGFREYFHPETGTGMGAKDFTWGGLVIDME